MSLCLLAPFTFYFSVIITASTKVEITEGYSSVNSRSQRKRSRINPLVQLANRSNKYNIRNNSNVNLFGG